MPDMSILIITGEKNNTYMFCSSALMSFCRELEFSLHGLKNGEKTSNVTNFKKLTTINYLQCYYIIIILSLRPKNTLN